MPLDFHSFSHFINSLMDEAGKLPAVQKKQYEQNFMRIQFYLKMEENMKGSISNLELKKDYLRQFVLMVRYCYLYNNVISKHPDKIVYSKYAERMKQRVGEYLESMEVLKSKHLKSIYVKMREKHDVERKAKTLTDLEERMQKLKASLPRKKKKKKKIKPEPMPTIPQIPQQMDHQPNGPSISTGTSYPGLEDPYPGLSDSSTHQPQPTGSPSISTGTSYPGLEDPYPGLSDSNDHLAPSISTGTSYGNLSPTPQPTSPSLYGGGDMNINQQQTSLNPSSQQELKTVKINQRLIDDFLNYAHEHLKLNIEFCGILCGRLVGEEFHVTHCLLPDQKGSEVACECTDEMQMYEYQSKHNLVSIGWVHIHPTQKAFLSTVDLVQQFAFQSLLPESIAIVCAPQSSPKQGIFRIKDAQAMEAVKQAMNRDKDIRGGRKHAQISERVLFEAAPQAICHYNVKIPYEVVDLRRNKKVQRIQPGSGSSPIFQQPQQTFQYGGRYPQNNFNQPRPPPSHQSSSFQGYPGSSSNNGNNFHYPS